MNLQTNTKSSSNKIDMDIAVEKTTLDDSHANFAIRMQKSVVHEGHDFLI